MTGGVDSGNYVLAQSTATTTADIGVVVAESLAGTWSLLPIMPQQLTPTILPAALAPWVTTPAASQLDLTLPTGFIGRTATTAAYDAVNGADADAQITVTLIQPSTSQSPGTISVSVPEEMVMSGRGFNIPLPDSLLQAAAAGKLQITQKDGKRLPSWLRYDRGNQLSSGAIQAGALPIELLVRIGLQRWTLLIYERASR